METDGILRANRPNKGIFPAIWQDPSFVLSCLGLFVTRSVHPHSFAFKRKLQRRYREFILVGNLFLYSYGFCYLLLKSFARSGEKEENC
jgi:O-antigen ligase